MSGGDDTAARTWPRRIAPWLLAASLLLGLPVLAIDDPDAPDRIGAFTRQAEGFEQQFAEASNDQAQSRVATEYGRFLDAELNSAFRNLSKRLDPAERQALLTAQRRWLVFRDAEIGFIDQNWTPQHFGTSSRLSRAIHSHALTRSRVEQLLAYLREYPP